MNTIQSSSSSPLRIDTIQLPGNRGQIGMTLCPGKKDSGYSERVRESNHPRVQ